MPEPRPEIGRGGNDGQRAGHPDQHVHQLMQAQPQPKLGEHQPREHDLRQRVRLADQQRLHAERPRQHPRQHHGADDEDVAAHHRDHQPRRQMAGKAQRDIDADEQRLVGDRVEIGAELAVPAKRLAR